MTSWIGPKPEIETPKFTTPLEVVGSTVQDSEGTTLFVVDLPYSYAEDCEFAEFLAETLNKALTPGYNTAPDPEPEEEDFGPSGLYRAFDWYRVSTFPLWFIFAENQHQANTDHQTRNLVKAQASQWTYGSSTPGYNGQTW